MERPTPDGMLIIVMREPVDKDGFIIDSQTGMVYWPNEAYTVKYPFSQMKHWDKNEDGIVICNHDQPGRTCWPWNSIQYYDLRLNSDNYLAELKVFQEQHDHTWLPFEEPADVFGITKKDSETAFWCGPSKTGEEGCGARRLEGVVQYG